MKANYLLQTWCSVPSTLAMEENHCKGQSSNWPRFPFPGDYSPFATANHSSSTFQETELRNTRNPHFLLFHYLQVFSEILVKQVACMNSQLFCKLVNFSLENLDFLSLRCCPEEFCDKEEVIYGIIHNSTL